MKDHAKHFIHRIKSLQSTGKQSGFSAGLFPSFRSNPLVGYRRPDETIFFPAITAFTLRSIAPDTDAETQQAIGTILEGVKRNFPDFRNKDGLLTYNFWKTKPSRHFPGGHIFRHFEHFRIPDDVDDTAFIYMLSEPGERDRIWLKEKLSLHANGAGQRIRNTYPEYQQLQAYSTWFGKNMYIEFDVSVLCNLLYGIHYLGLPLNRNDEDAFAYIRSVIETDRYRTEPFRCAHQYPRTPLIMYHVARLIGAFAPAALEPLREKLVADIREELGNVASPMDRVILSTSLLRLGVETERIAVEKLTVEDFKGFYFFIAGLLTAYEHPILYRIATLPVFHMYWTCEAHCWALLAEYEVYWSRYVQSAHKLGKSE